MKGVLDYQLHKGKHHIATNELKSVFIGLKIWRNYIYMLIVNDKKNNNGNNCYLASTMIFCINILTTERLWIKYRSCKLLSQVQKFINIWYLNITSNNKFHHNTWAIGINTTNITYQIDYDILSHLSQYLRGMCADDITWARIVTYAGQE